MSGDLSPQVETICLNAEAPGAFERAVLLLNRGELVAFPTDTVYGIGAHAFLEGAVACLYRVKDRPAHLPIPLLLPDAAAMSRVCTDIPSLAWQLAQEFWPGGLSLILRKAAIVPAAVAAGGSTVAVRVPDHPLVRDLCRHLGTPLAATSANAHGQPPPVTAAGVKASLGQRVPLILDGGRCEGGMASTVLDLTVSPPAILRPGPITAESLAAVVTLRSD